MKRIPRWVMMVAPLGGLVGCDHATKYVARATLQNQPPREILRSMLDLRYVENTDIAFSMLRWIPVQVRWPLLVVFGALAILGLLVMVLRRPSGRMKRAGLVLILAGALGNYADRLTRGYVVDFIHVHHWPVFNVADMCVTAGAVLLFWATLLKQGGKGGKGAGTIWVSDRQ